MGGPSLCCGALVQGPTATLPAQGQVSSCSQTSVLGAKHSSPEWLVPQAIFTMVFPARAWTLRGVGWGSNTIFTVPSLALYCRVGTAQGAFSFAQKCFT